jgi:hypothetical protein
MKLQRSRQRLSPSFGEGSVASALGIADDWGFYRYQPTWTFLHTELHHEGIVR